MTPRKKKKMLSSHSLYTFLISCPLWCSCISLRPEEHRHCVLLLLFCSSFLPSPVVYFSYALPPGDRTFAQSRCVSLWSREKWKCLNQCTFITSFVWYWGIGAPFSSISCEMLQTQIVPSTSFDFPAPGWGWTLSQARCDSLIAFSLSHTPFIKHHFRLHLTNLSLRHSWISVRWGIFLLLLYSAHFQADLPLHLILAFVSAKCKRPPLCPLNPAPLLL